MIIFYPNLSSMRTFVAPGKTVDSSDFRDKDGSPIMFEVVFDEHGRADVPDGLGRFMVDSGLAQTHGVLLLE